ncbi:MAG: hypothetical protein LQ350_004426 [Teloschistes chrysophthalmus]|nr:MAG: hypothetical protein LQ350_004426 [Niorma chrysophthalma]
MGQSRQSNKRINTGGEVDGASCQKHRRTARATRSAKIANYDMKYHPMDDVLRPHHSAVRKAAHGLARQPSVETTESSTIEQSSDSVTTDRSGSASIASPDPLTRPCRPSAPIPGSPSTRRVTRVRNRVKPIAYNMKHHPMDDFLRPADARKRKAKWARGLVEADESPAAMDSTPSVATDLESDEGILPNVQEEAQMQSSTVSTESRQHPSASHNALLVPPLPLFQPPLNRLATSNREPSPDILPEITPWKSLKDDDRLLYLVPKGTPLSGNIMPVAWSDVATALDLKPDSFSGSVGVLQTIEQLQVLYSNVYKNAQDYFGVTPEPSENPTLHYAEGFDVYHRDVGDSYWAHSNDSIVRPTDFARATPVADQELRQPGQKDVRVRFDSITIPGDALLNPLTGEERLFENHNVGSDERDHYQVHPHETEQMTIQDSQEAGAATAQRDIEETDHGLFGSYNSEAGYLRQVLGSFDETQMESSPELELVASMRNELAGDVDDLFEPNELDHMLHSSSPPHSDGGVRVPDRHGKSKEKKKSEELFVNHSETESESEDEDGDTRAPIAHQRPSPKNQTPPSKHTRKQQSPTRPSKPKTNTKGSSRQFSVHEDPPNTTPRIRRMVAKNPRSPGTDMPKENLRERSVSE